MATDQVVSTTKCRECGGVMEGRKGEYKYVESGLDSVVLKDILVFHCKHCNAIVPEIPAVGILHWFIALKLLHKKTLLTGAEMRYLRKLCGYSVNDFAEIMGSTKAVISRWETQSVHGEGTDRIVRLLIVGNIVRMVTGQAQPILKRIHVDRLCSEIETALKQIQDKRENVRKTRYEISPDDLANFGQGQTHLAEFEPSAAAVN